MLHRDDVPFEKIEELERQIREATGNPDEKILFPGDISDLPKDILDKIKEMEELGEESVNRGFCIDCLQAMSIYRPWEENWKMEDGWLVLMQPNDEPAGWLCPDCVFAMTEGKDIDENERWTITDEGELEGDFE